jgi:2-dehydropantoate 2-reductase
MARPWTLVIGGGALGTLLCARLARVGRVTLLTRWEEHGAAIEARGGITLLSEEEGRLVTGVEVARCAADVQLTVGARPDAILLAVKHSGTQRAAEDVADVLARAMAAGCALPDAAGCLVASMQNGIGNSAIVARELARRGMLEDAAARITVAQGLTTNGATIVEPGVVRHAGRGPTEVGIARAHSVTRDAEAVERLCATLSAAGLAARAREDIETAVWEKLAVNAAINALSALLRVPNGSVHASPACRSLAQRVVSEVAAVARAEGAALALDADAALLERALRVAERTAANRSSMLTDVLAGRQTEVGAINGAVVAAGAARGIATPTNALLVELLAATHETRGERVAGAQLQARR